ncbi:MAG: alpha/beta hydrolase [Oscillospiraceae bacterium]|jgi:pimeloyl-ACP methyl ester carboxylesterase|nr:alpha/beta hydrolase [Oscillospiraceae bacterium]
MGKAKKFFAVFLTFAMLLSLPVIGSAQSDDLPFSDSAFYETGDYSIHYRFKPATAEFAGRIALLHGFISSTVVWEDMAALLNAAGYDCLLIDLPGFGYSTRETAGVSPIPREDLVADVMWEVAPDEPWILGGHSMGGGAALTVVNKYPELVSALVLYAPVGDFSDWGSGYSDGYTTFLGNMLNMVWNSLLNIASISFVGKSIKQAHGYDADYDLNGRVIAPLRVKNTAMSMLFMMKRLTPIDFEITRQLTIPVLLCLAENDESVANDSPEALAVENGLPAQYEKVIVPDAPHTFVETRAETAAGITLDFLAAD